MIGWDPLAHSLRLKLVVQLRRLLVLEKHNLPSLIADDQDDKTRAINLILHAKPIP